ncbi:cytochrome p450 family protein [Diplodia corticola]|uniref:Cytochrome p450 family protein n=1 Tax=Diplodia corticola TaxID=236234 RepID=A0A1J9RB63_9PEZI|nr:cytochrome p450 family protein [Diplodia corticola]OJD29667.1 cytochrome p450 family protein [Diplodia corticola]
MLLDTKVNLTTDKLVFAGPALVAIFFVFTCVYRRYFSPLAKYPGPFWASVTDLWLVWLHFQPDHHHRLVKLHNQYGPVVRLKPNKLSISSPEAFRIIYGAGNGFPKSDFYSVFAGTRPFDLFAQQDERIHGQQRRLVATAYTLETMKSLEPYVNTTIHVLLDKLRELGAKGEPFDIAYLLQLFAFDIIGELSFAKRFGYTDALSDFGTFSQISAALASGARVGEVPWFYRLHQRLAPYIGNHLALAARNGALHDFTLRAMASRKDRMTPNDDDNNESNHGDILSKLLAASAQKPQLTDQYIGFALTSNVVAGSDTTSISLCAMLLHLLRPSSSTPSAPSALSRLLRELRDKVDAGEIPDPAADPHAVVPQRVTERWPFLQAVVYEALRLHPVVGSLLARVVPAGGLSFDGGCFVPAGTEVGTSAWVIHRDESIFGPDADAFRPERWLDEGNKQKMHRFFFAFGGGSRTCIGKNIAMLEMSKVLPTLLLHFDFRLADKNEHPKDTYTNLVSLKPFHVVARRRNILQEA